MSKLKVVPYRILKKVIEECGFVWIRCVGSHNVFKHPNGQAITVPDHGSETIKGPLLRRLIRDLGLSIVEYNKLLHKNK